MQTLVYDNYNKFISATDMIRKVSLKFVILVMVHLVVPSFFLITN